MEFNALKDKMSVLKPKRSWLRFSFIVIAAIVTVVIILAGAMATYGKYYAGKVYPGVYVGHYHLGGMSISEVQAFAENLNDRLSKEGIEFVVNDGNVDSVHFKINTVLLSEDSTVELAKLDSGRLADNAFAIGRGGNWVQKLFLPLYYRLFVPIAVFAPVDMNEDNLNEVLKSNLVQYEDRPHNASIHITEWGTGSYDVIPERAGRMFVIDDIKKQIRDNLAVLLFVPIKISPQQFTPVIFAKDIAGLRENIQTVFGYGDLGVNYIDPQTKIRRDWPLTVPLLLGWVNVILDDNQRPVLALDESKVKKYLEEQVRPTVDILPQDGKFSMDNGKVKELKGSQSGLTLNTDKTFSELNQVFIDRNYRPASAMKTVSVSVDVVEPQIKISDINEFGITDVIGAGFSTFHDSHSNRIKNIAHAVDRLNGVLIRPDEEFSALKYAGPFTSENGYLPEAVIKGNVIKNEIGGGMCQIGTTLFRMAMNAGMDITQRQNHSLVVSYYADPVNGNPGTDAALYEPMLDLKFKNDTGAYLLLETNIDYKKQQLTFTLWGRPDGRKGSFTHPLVSRWISAGDPQTVVSDTLKPGAEKCQSAFRGAVASFTYTRFTSSSEKIDRVFTSYYRPLPKICMVGPSATSTAAGEAPADAADIIEPVGEEVVVPTP